MIAIRRMTIKDVAVARELLLQLGYSMDVHEVRRRYHAVAAAGDHAMMVAEHNEHVVALCHIYVRPALDKPPEALVQAIVVDQALRGSGVGRLIMAAAETWASDRGFTSVALASNVMRAEAHAFYEAIGYQRAATSHLFRKNLGVIS